MTWRALTLLPCSSLLIALAPPAIAADGLRISAGFDYTSGDYGESETTQIWSFPLSLGYTRGALGLKISVPYLHVSGPGDVIPGITPVVSDRRRGASKPEDDPGAGGGGGGTTTTRTRTTNSGIGDVVATATYAFINDPQAWRLALTGKVKFPTANENKNLGTGETDYSAQVDLDRVIGRVTPFGSVGYRWLGTRADLDLRNVWYATLGAAWKVTDWTSIDVAYDWGQATSAGGDDIGEVTLGVSHWFGDHWKLSAYLLRGVSDGSPDWGGGASVGYAF
ncbi:MAG TPA: hypothetical protein VFB54_03400 [Burkholderiales bacterium]|nr:hypothetical protein [Burkholderiales bacterium]